MSGDTEARRVGIESFLGPIKDLYDGWQGLRSGQTQRVHQKSAEKLITAICQLVLAVFAAAALYKASSFGVAAVAVTWIACSAVSLPATGFPTMCLVYAWTIHQIAIKHPRQIFVDGVMRANPSATDLAARRKAFGAFLGSSFLNILVMSRYPIGFADTRIIPHIVDYCKPRVLSYYGYRDAYGQRPEGKDAS